MKEIDSKSNVIIILNWFLQECIFRIVGLVIINMCLTITYRMINEVSTMEQNWLVGIALAINIILPFFGFVLGVVLVIGGFRLDELLFP